MSSPPSIVGREHAANGGGTVVHGRYVLQHHLGVGTTGAVFSALDRDTGETVAIKALTRATPRSVLRFKRSFRGLNSLRSAHLVRLLSLHEHAGEWFLVMEAIEGRPFDVAMAEHRDRGDFDAIRRALCQVAVGLDDLHTAGFVHRDLKPANVLVDAAGNPRLLDFELVDLVPDARTRHEGVELVGTPRYMAPEQIRRQPSQPATDYYALGVMAFFVLTGRHAHDGTPAAIFASRCQADTPPPSPAAVARVPEDLDQLVVSLLAHDADARAGLDDVLSCGHAVASRTPPPRLGANADRPAAFVGRHDEMACIRAALARARGSSSPAVVTIVGPAGRGKSALLDQVSAVCRRDGVLVLPGRCRQLESVPYRGVDEIVDGLSTYLRSLPDVDVDDWVDDRAAALVRSFPVLGLVPAVARAARDTRPPDEPQAARRSAAGALARLLTGVARQRPVLCVVDDLQWCDVDGEVVLRNLTADERPDGVHWVFATRPPVADAPDQAPARRLLSEPALADATRIAPSPLSRAERLALTSTWLSAERSQAFVDMLGADGHEPFALVTLARIAAEEPARTLDTRDVEGLCGLIRARYGELSGPERRVVEGLALAQGSVDSFMVRAWLDDAARGALESLERRGWVRASVRGDASVVELAHDRLREWIEPTLDEARRQATHRRLAEAFEQRSDHRPGQHWAVAQHRHGAGEFEAAAKAAECAADHAIEAFAFERAREAYAMSVKSLADQAPPRLIEKLADVHRDDGRGDVAADLYLGLARRITVAPPERSSAETRATPDEFRRKAARALLDQGYDARGMEVLAGVLAEVEVTPPRSTTGAVARIVAARRRLPSSLWEGLPQGSSFANANRRRADACWAASIGYALGDPTASIFFHTQHLQAASGSDDPDRIARAVCLDLSFRAPEGGKLAERNVALAVRCQELWSRHPDRYVRGVLAIGRGLMHFHLGEFDRSADLLGRAMATFRARCRDFAKETAIAQSYELASLAMLGRFEELGRRIEVYLPAAQARRNFFVMCLSQIGAISRLWLARDRPQEARARAERALSEWSHESRLSQHMLGRLSLAEADLFEGDHAGALVTIETQLGILRHSMLGRAQVARVMMHFARGRCALAGLADDPTRRAPRLACRVARDIRALEREQRPWSDALALMLRGSLARIRGDERDAASLLRRAKSACTEAGLGLHAAASAHALGQLLGGDAGRALLDEAHHRLGHGDANTEFPVGLMRVMLPVPR